MEKHNTSTVYSSSATLLSLNTLHSFLARFWRKQSTYHHKWPWYPTSAIIKNFQQVLAYLIQNAPQSGPQSSRECLLPNQCPINSSHKSIREGLDQTNPPLHTSLKRCISRYLSRPHDEEHTAQQGTHHGCSVQLRYSRTDFAQCTDSRWDQQAKGTVSSLWQGLQGRQGGRAEVFWGH